MLPVATHWVGDDDGIPLCPGCLEPLTTPCHFCSVCATPVTAYAATAPLEQVWALGTFVSRLLSRRPNKLVITGTALLAFPGCVTLFSVLFDLARMVVLPFAAYEAAFFFLVAAIPGVLLQGLYILLMVRVWRTRERSSPCGTCGYDLTGNESGTCPECGEAIGEA